MKFRLNIFLQFMKGIWISQKTIYYLTTNKICCNQFKYIIRQNNNSLFFDKKNTKQTEIYTFIENHNTKSGTIAKKNSHNWYNYQYLIYKDNCLKIQYTKQDMEYIEYIYTINEKLNTTIGLLKKADKYLAISFSSNIKIKESPLK